MKHTTRISIMTAILIILCLAGPTVNVKAAISDYISFVILSDYSLTLDIGDKTQISAITSTLKKATWKSSNSTVASVGTTGVITAKKAGTALITAKIKNAEASCLVNVKETEVTISKSEISIENHETYKLTAKASNNSKITWKSSRKSIAVVSKSGTVTAKKPGETTITASADGSSCECIVTVREPVVVLNKETASLYRNQTLQLYADVSSKGSKQVWKTNKRSVATVSKTGLVTAKKNGTAVISVTVDGVTESCEIIVLKPEITLENSELYLNAKDTYILIPRVSSGNKPAFSSSNTDIVTVSQNGRITARKHGKAYITVSEDGMKVKCTVIVAKSTK